jgi:hypothetical protein
MRYIGLFRWFSEISSNEKLSKSFSLSSRVWKRFKCVTDGISHEKLTFRAVQVCSTRYFYFQYIYDARLLFWLYSILVKCDQQPQGTHLCGYYVCEFICTFTSEHKDYTYDVGNTHSHLYFYPLFFVIMIDIHIDLLFLYSLRPCRRSTYQSNARLLLQRN